MGRLTPRAALPLFVGLFGFFTPFTIAGAHISLGLATLFLLLHGDSRRAAWRLARTHPLARPIALWIVVSVLAVVFAVDPAQSAEKLKKLLLIVLLPLGALPVVRERLRLIVGATIASAALVALYGLVIFLQQGGGLDARLRGIGGFYMTVAGILMIVGLLVTGELLSALKDPRRRRLAFLGVSTALIGGALLATYTRGSWIGFAAGLLLLLRKRVAVLAGVLLVGVLLVALGPPDGRDRLLSIFEPGHPRNAERMMIWRHGLGMIGERPIFGAGLVIPRELMEHEEQTAEGVIRVHSHMHNTPLQIAVSMGLPAVAVFAWMMVAFLRMGWRARRGEIWNLWEQGAVDAYLPIVAALLVNGMFEWNFGDSEVLGLFYFVSGLVLGVEAGPDAGRSSVTASGAPGPEVRS